VPLNLSAITSTGDRRYSFAVLAQLERHGFREPLAEALRATADPRLVPRLSQLLLARDTPRSLRELSAELLFGHGLMRDDAAWRRRQWTSAPEVVRFELLVPFDTTFDSELLDILRTPNHPWLLHGLRCAARVFAPSDMVTAMRDLLGHPRADVREETLRTLMLPEPRSAWAEICACLEDPCTDVVDAAVETLTYYPSVGTWEVLHRTSPRWLPRVGENMGADRQVLYDLLNVWTGAQDTPAGPHVWAWLAAARGSVVALARSEAEEVERYRRSWGFPMRASMPPVWGTAASAPFARPSTKVSLRELDAMLDRVDAPAKTIHEALWSRRLVDEVPAPRRRRWAQRFLSHDDPEVRAASLAWFASWSDVDALLSASQQGGSHAREAMRWLWGADKDPRIAARAHEILMSTPPFATEREYAVQAWAAHTSDPVPGLVELAEHTEDRRNDVLMELARLKHLHCVSPRWELEHDTWDGVITWLESAVIHGLPCAVPSSIWAQDDADLKRALVRAVRAGITEAPKMPMRSQNRPAI
jgi:hypothetical protein